MVGEAHRAARTIDDLLELSRIELGGAAAKDVVAVAQVVDDAVARAQAARSITPSRSSSQRARRSSCCGQPSATGLGGRQPARERREVQQHRIGGHRRIPSRRSTGSRSSSPTPASASRPATSTGSSSASTVSIGPVAATPEAPGLACRSCATWQRTTLARSRFSPARERAPSSPSAFHLAAFRPSPRRIPSGQP